MEARVATDHDLEPATELLAAAFAKDPLWSWAFEEEGALREWWRMFIGSSIPLGWVWVLGDFAAVASWIPPGEDELTAADEARVEPLVAELAGPRAPQVLELVERFESAHPVDVPHYYLSLLGTDPARRGQGHGMSLLEQNLALLDAEGMPAYLESSNPDNCRLYERHGFRRSGEFERPDGGLKIPTMWREGRRSP